MRTPIFISVKNLSLQNGGFIRASVKKISDMIRDRVRILYLIISMCITQIASFTV